MTKSQIRKSSSSQLIDFLTDDNLEHSYYNINYLRVATKSELILLSERELEIDQLKKQIAKRFEEEQVSTTVE